MPTYGFGSEAGNEAGYVVGMGACYPEPGSVKISSKDVLRMQSNYSTFRGRTGVMGLFYILVASDNFFYDQFQEFGLFRFGKIWNPRTVKRLLVIIGFVGGIAAFGLGSVLSIQKATIREIPICFQMNWVTFVVQ
ncbi:hypothetical protein O6H91_18G018900 [Diphasiastrum complanatum]|uniref:Uncharacterized protein n=1 Tax=Diphasiastrum complanatum TaxID=34168 RepID=A0ACC2AYH8_DIPCM|nr:hypothetical protein O6H91_18G018900 [Diphasiastrum complanatum]